MTLNTECERNKGACEEIQFCVNKYLILCVKTNPILCVDTEYSMY